MKLFSISMLMLFGILLSLNQGFAAVCFNKEFATKWYCADVNGCSDAEDEASSFSPAQCDPLCADMGLDTKIDYTEPDEVDADLETDGPCNQACRIRVIRSCTY